MRKYDVLYSGSRQTEYTCQNCYRVFLLVLISGLTSFLHTKQHLTTYPIIMTLITGLYALSKFYGRLDGTTAGWFTGGRWGGLPCNFKPITDGRPGPWVLLLFTCLDWDLGLWSVVEIIGAEFNDVMGRWLRIERAIFTESSQGGTHRRRRSRFLSHKSASFVSECTRWHIPNNCSPQSLRFKSLFSEHILC